MGKRRRRSSRDSFWMQQYGGMPGWGLAAAVAVLGVFAVGIVMNLPTSSTASPYPSSTLRTDFFAESSPSPEAPTVEAPLTSDGELRALFIGDSVTRAFYATTEADGFQQRTVEGLEEFAPVDATVVATPGATTSQVAEDVETIAEDTGLVVVELGTNDIFYGDVESFTEAYTALLDRIESEAPSAGLVCVGAMTDSRIGPDVNRIIREQCTDREGVYVRMADISTLERYRTPAGTSTWQGDAADGVHPNDTAHEIIANRIVRAVTVG